MFFAFLQRWHRVTESLPQHVSWCPNFQRDPGGATRCLTAAPGGHTQVHEGTEWVHSSSFLFLSYTPSLSMYPLNVNICTCILFLYILHVSVYPVVISPPRQICRELMLYNGHLHWHPCLVKVFGAGLLSWLYIHI